MLLELVLPRKQKMEEKSIFTRKESIYTKINILERKTNLFFELFGRKNKIIS